MKQTPPHGSDVRGSAPAGRDPIGREHRAEIVDRLYDVALDPIRLVDLLNAWEGRLGPLRDSSEAPIIDDPSLNAHVSRASIFLDRFEATRPDGHYRSILNDIPRSAAFVSDGGPVLTAFNRAAAVAFGLEEQARFDSLPFEPEDRAMLRDVVRRMAGPLADAGEKVITLRIRSVVTGGPVIIRVSRVERDEEPPLALVISTELAWPEGFETTVRDAFGLTGAEVEIVQGITLGLPVREIAAARGRSQETVRTQLRSILSKTETHSQSELVRVVLGLMDVATLPSTHVDVAARRSANPRQVEFRALRLPDGRRLDYIEFGDPEGRPVLYMHLDYGLIRWPRSAEKAAMARRLRIVVPVRAGYGGSSPLPASVDRTLVCSQDYAAALDHLGIRRVTVVALGADLRFALMLSALRPGMVAGIVGCGAQLPLRTAAQYERMDKWQRFILANARYAPKVLPFLVKAGFSLARKLGKDRFLEQVNSGSPADIDTFSDPEVREAILNGSRVTLSDDFSAHEAFTQEAISSESDWSTLLENVAVPVVLLQGDQDPQTPMLTVRELMPDFPQLEVHFLPFNGQLVFFREWQRTLDEINRFL